MPDLNKNSSNLNKGVKYEYIMPNKTENQEDTKEEKNDVPLEDLMAKLKNL